MAQQLMSQELSDLQSAEGLALVAAQSGSGSPEPGCFFGPEDFYSRLFRESPSLTGLPFDQVRESATGTKLQAFSGLLEFNTRLAAVCFSLKSQNHFPLIVGGDHSCAIGTWSGISSALGERLGLLWIDAHMDAHTMISTESGAIHGMPVASLLGLGNSEMASIGGLSSKLDPNRLVLFGVRSYEPGEAANLEKLGVRVYTMKEIEERGFQVCWKEAALRVRGSFVQHFGISLDLDALDPADCPGVGSPEDGGLRASELLPALSDLMRHKGLTAFEMVEYNPEFEDSLKTFEFMKSLFQCLKNARAELRPDLVPNGKNIEILGANATHFFGNTF